MEAASNIIGDALLEILAIPSEVSIEAYEAQAGIFYLNALMDDLATNGINLGYTCVKDLGDAITVADGALEPIVKNLAIELSPAFKGTVTSQDLFNQAADGLDVLRQISFEQPGPSPYSTNLPTGSGNNELRDDRYYQSDSEPLLTELGGNIAPEEVPDES
jgi:hypothetical protein